MGEKAIPSSAGSYQRNERKKTLPTKGDSPRSSSVMHPPQRWEMQAEYRQKGKTLTGEKGTGSTAKWDTTAIRLGNSRRPATHCCRKREGKEKGRNANISGGVGKDQNRKTWRKRNHHKQKMRDFPITK